MTICSKGIDNARSISGPISYLSSIPEDQREAYLRPLLDPVPNAIYTLDFDENYRVYFTVQACRFAQLCTQLEVPELAPLFCEVDDYFFRHDLPQVELERNTTIAHGGKQCPFVLSLSDESKASLDVLDLD